MPFELKGAYSIVLDLIYLQGGELPDDPRYIAGQLNVSVRKWSSLRKQLLDFDKIQITGGLLTNYRAIIELERLSKFSDKQAENARAPRKNKGLQKPTHKPKQSHTEPEPEPYKNIQKDFGLFWECYPEKKGKKPALDKFTRAVKSGVDPSLIIEGARRYQRFETVRSGFVKNPATWLFNECWNDEENSKPMNSNTSRAEQYRRMS